MTDRMLEQSGPPALPLGPSPSRHSADLERAGFE